MLTGDIRAMEKDMILESCQGTNLDVHEQMDGEESVCMCVRACTCVHACIHNAILFDHEEQNCVFRTTDEKGDDAM